MKLMKLKVWCLQEERKKKKKKKKKKKRGVAGPVPV